MSQYQSFFISASGNSSQCDEINHFLRSHVVILTIENIINSCSNCGIQILVEYKDIQYNWVLSLARAENWNDNERFVCTSRKFWLFYFLFNNKTPLMLKYKKSAVYNLGLSLFFKFTTSPHWQFPKNMLYYKYEQTAIPANRHSDIWRTSHKKLHLCR